MLDFYPVKIVSARFVFLNLIFIILVIITSCSSNNKNGSSNIGLSKSETNIYIKNSYDEFEAEITRRLKKRNGFNLKVINKFKKIQLSAEIKKRKSNYIVKNNFKHDFIKKSVKNIKRNILLNA